MFPLSQNGKAAKLVAQGLGLSVKSLAEKTKVERGPRKWKHVHFHKKERTWVGQKGGDFICSHRTQDEAAKHVAKKLGVTLDPISLKHGAKFTAATHQSSKYRHVHFHARRNKWYANVRQTHIGSFESELAAAQSVVSAGHAKDLKSLRKKRHIDGRSGTALALPRPAGKRMIVRASSLKASPSVCFRFSS